jgi:hypothetical protein
LAVRERSELTNRSRRTAFAASSEQSAAPYQPVAAAIPAAHPDAKLWVKPAARTRPE